MACVAASTATRNARAATVTTAARARSLAIPKTTAGVHRFTRAFRFHKRRRSISRGWTTAAVGHRIADRAFHRDRAVRLVRDGRDVRGRSFRRNGRLFDQLNVRRIPLRVIVHVHIVGRIVLRLILPRQNLGARRTNSAQSIEQLHGRIREAGSRCRIILSDHGGRGTDCQTYCYEEMTCHGGALPTTRCAGR